MSDCANDIHSVAVSAMYLLQGMKAEMQGKYPEDVFTKNYEHVFGVETNLFEHLVDIAIKVEIEWDSYDKDKYELIGVWHYDVVEPVGAEIGAYGMTYNEFPSRELVFDWIERHAAEWFCNHYC